MRLLTQKTSFEHPYGDLYGDYEEYVRLHNPKDIRQAYTLSAIDVNPWRALHEIAPEAAELLQTLSEYECPYVEATYHAVLPCFLLTHHPERYESFLRQASIKEYWAELTNGTPKSTCVNNISSFQHCLLGTGYRDYALMSDGNFSYQYVVADFDNGDSILCIAMIWHNK